MELEMDFNLDSESLDGGPSVSSLILGSPSGKEESPTDSLPDPETQPIDKGKPKSPRADVKRLSQSQRRRLKRLLSLGHSREEAIGIVRQPVDQADRSGQVATKRQRSTETASPNTSAKGPSSKKPRDLACAEPPAPRQTSGVTYREMLEATSLSITTIDYPASLLTPEQLKTVRDAILDCIADQESPAIRPKFRSYRLKNGTLQLDCADNDTVRWLETTASSLIPWEGAHLSVFRTKDLPKALKFVGYFQDSVDTTNERILRLLQNQNDGFSTRAWRVCHRNVTGKTVELMVELDQQSANLIAAQSFLLNYKYGKARMRQVGRKSSNTGAKGSGAKAGTVRSETPSGSVPLPPARRTPAIAKKVPPKNRKRSKREHLNSRDPQGQIPPPKRESSTSVAYCLLQREPVAEGMQTTHPSVTADGNRPPIGSQLDPTKDALPTK